MKTKNKLQFKTAELLQGAVIGAIYAVLTMVLTPISYGVMQVRVSEALTVLPRFFPGAVPGLFIGCFVANLISPYGVIDLVCGSGATLLAAVFSYLLRNRPWLVPLPPVVFNGIIVGCMLYYAYGVPISLWVCMGWVALGEALACYLIGMPLMKCLEKYKHVFKL